MANRYWVNGSGNWDKTDGTHWSTSSGGSGGASAPTSSDSVFFDANSSSGSYTVTIPEDAAPSTPGCNCLDLTTAAPASGTMTLLQVGRGIPYVYGSVSFHSGLSITQTGTGSHILFLSATSATLTSNGTNIPWIISVRTNLTLLDDLSCNSGDGELNPQSGVFDANGHNVTTQAVLFNQVFDREVKLGTGLWTITNDGGWSILNNSGTVTITLPSPASASTIKFTGSSNNTSSFGSPGGRPGHTYGVLELATTGASLFQVSGNNTFDTIKTTTLNRNIQFEAGKTTHVTNFQCSGTASNLNTITSITAAQHYLVKDGSGIVSNDYLSLSYSSASPSSNTWYAGTHSTDGGNNAGWAFTNPNIQQAVGGALSFSGSPATNHKTVSGVTEDRNTNPLGNCTVWLESNTDPMLQVSEGTSDGSGNYSLKTAYTGQVRVLTTKAGTPNIQGVGDLVTPV